MASTELVGLLTEAVTKLMEGRDAKLEGIIRHLIRETFQKELQLECDKVIRRTIEQAATAAIKVRVELQP
jgi:hypothetical protein